MLDKYESYIIALRQIEDSESKLKNNKLKSFRYHPKISIIMPVYNTGEQWLRLAVESVINQVYDRWELCIAEGGSTKDYIRNVLEEYQNKDSRIKVVYLEKNKGIAGNSNAALALANGDFVGFLDHDDELNSSALYEVLKALNEEKEADLIYTDEDKISTAGKRFDPHFKPDWSPDYFRSNNYLCHFVVIRKKIVDAIGGFREGYDGSQDYDILLRSVEQARKILHIPKVLYHWRSHEESVASNLEVKMYAYESAKKALKDHIERLGIQGAVNDGIHLGCYRIKYQINESPKISIIIPTKDNADILKKCIDSILEKNTYRNFEIVIVDNQSSEDKTLEYLNEIVKRPEIRVLKYDSEFNFSALNNYAVSRIDSEYIILLNNDTEVISPEWIESMLEFIQRQDVGAVGALLYYPDNTFQHAGLIVGINDIAGYSFCRTSNDNIGYMGRAKLIQNLSAVTAACMAIKKSVFNKVGGFDKNLSLAFNDVDLCLKIRGKGYLVVYNPYVQLYHNESYTRGYETTLNKQLRFSKEIKYFQNKWKNFLEKGDPYYNPNLTLYRVDFSIKDVPELLGKEMKLFDLYTKLWDRERESWEKDLKIHYLNTAVYERDVKLIEKDQKIHELNTDVYNRDLKIIEKDQKIHELNTDVYNRDLKIIEKDQKIHELNTDVYNRDVKLIEKDQKIHELNTDVYNKDLKLIEKDQKIHELNTDVYNRDVKLIEKDQKIHELNTDIYNRDVKLIEKDQKIHELNTDVYNRDLKIIEKDQTIHELNTALWENDNRINDLKKSLWEKNARIHDLNTEAWEKHIQIQNLHKTISNMDMALRRMISKGGVSMDEKMAAHRVLIISGIEGAPFIYRCMNIKDQLYYLGYHQTSCKMQHEIMPEKDVEPHDIIILNRPYPEQRIIDVINLCHKNGKILVFSTDDLVTDHDVEIYLDLDRHMSLSALAMFHQGVTWSQDIIKLSDAVIVSTQYLKSRIENFGKNVYVLENSLNDKQLTKAEKLRKDFIEKKKKRDEIIIGYFSGWPHDHDDDFELVEGSLKKILNDYDKVRLRIVGYLDIDEKLGNFKEKIEHIDFVPFDVLPKYIANVDINIAPLVSNPHKRSKSAIKVLEAGILGVPTIASNLEPYNSFISHGKDGMLCSNADEWLESLTYLIKNKSAIFELGDKARYKARSEHTNIARSSRIADIIKNIIRDKNQGTVEIKADAALIDSEDLPARQRFIKKYISGSGIQLRTRREPLIIDSTIASVKIIQSYAEFPAIPDSSVDFIIADHFLEYAPNPIEIITTFHRILKKHSGIIYLAFSANVGNHKLTSLEHIIDDYYATKNKQKIRNFIHFWEWVTSVEHIESFDIAMERAKELSKTDCEISYHIFNEENFISLLNHIAQKLNIHFNILEKYADNTEYIYILKPVYKVYWEQ